MMEYLLEGTPEAGAEREKQQILNIATAASKIPTLEHYIQHTLPSGEKMANIFVGHLDVRLFAQGRLFPTDGMR